MPNHCNNALLIAGPKVELNRFFNSCIREGSGQSSERMPPEFYVDFNRLVPLGEDATNSDRADLWGTKWNSYDCNQLFLPRNHDNRVLFTFNTAWGPPLGAFFKGSRLYPNLFFTLMYFEPSNGFAGIYQIKNNKFMYENEQSPEMVELMNNVMGTDYAPDESLESGNERLKDKIMPQLENMPIVIKNVILLMLFVNKGGTDHYESTIPPLTSIMLLE